MNFEGRNCRLLLSDPDQYAFDQALEGLKERIRIQKPQDLRFFAAGDSILFKVGYPEPPLKNDGISHVLRLVSSEGRNLSNVRKHNFGANNVRGEFADPLLMGLDLLRVLGFHVHGADALYFPSIQRLEYGIGILNQNLSSENQIPWKFLAQRSVSSRTFLNNLGEFKIDIDVANIEWRLQDLATRSQFILIPLAEALRIEKIINFIVFPYLEFVGSSQNNALKEKNEIRDRIQAYAESLFDLVTRIPAILLKEEASRKSGEPLLLTSEEYFATRLLFGKMGIGPIISYISGSTDRGKRLAVEFVKINHIVIKELERDVFVENASEAPVDLIAVHRRLMSRLAVLSEAAQRVMTDLKTQQDK
ncbi:MAG: hypothetical protein K1X29_02380 [Bdellovibrionales bacterium]|nr:hypothetical protein [Bdellovibrionales bacterium]